MKKSLLIIPLLLAGCAKVSDYQASCEQRYPKLSDMANCLDSSVKNDSRMVSAPTTKLYVLAAKMLGKGVDEGKISDAQARLELQNLYVRLQSRGTGATDCAKPSIPAGFIELSGCKHNASDRAKSETACYNSTLSNTR